MSAIEMYYASMPMPTGPYCAEDDEDDDGMPLSDAEQAIMLEACYGDF
jgi:hypothetical protein